MTYKDSYTICFIIALSLYCFVVVAIFVFSLLCDFMFFFYVYELRLSATTLLNEYDDDDVLNIEAVSLGRLKHVTNFQQA